MYNFIGTPTEANHLKSRLETTISEYEISIIACKERLEIVNEFLSNK